MYMLKTAAYHSNNEYKKFTKIAQHVPLPPLPPSASQQWNNPMHLTPLRTFMPSPSLTLGGYSWRVNGTGPPILRQRRRSMKSSNSGRTSHAEIMWMCGAKPACFSSIRFKSIQFNSFHFHPFPSSSIQFPSVPLSSLSVHFQFTSNPFNKMKRNSTEETF